MGQPYPDGRPEKDRLKTQYFLPVWCLAAGSDSTILGTQADRGQLQQTQPRQPQREEQQMGDLLALYEGGQLRRNFAVA